MCAAGVEPNVITCNTVLSACQRAKLPHELLAIFGAMASLGVQPDAWGYSAAIHAFSQTGRMKQALELFHSMPREVPPSHHCFSAAMGACRRAQDYEGVLKLYSQLLATGAPTLAHTTPRTLTLEP